MLRGQYAGRTGRVRQFSNDWVTVDIDDGPTSEVVKPTWFQLITDEEFEMFRDHGPTVGFFWQMWELFPDGTFNRLHQNAGSERYVGSRRRGRRRTGRSR